MMRALSKTFFGGLATIIPLVLTLYLLWWLGSAAERGFGALLELGLPERFYVPGMGLFLGFLLTFAVGIVTRAWFVRQVLLLAEKGLLRIPLVGTIYGSFKDLVAFVGAGKRHGVKAVTVAVGDTELRLFGLVTRDSAAELTTDEADRDFTAVYLPFSYALGGFTVLAPRAGVKPLAMSAQDALRLAMTAGMSGEDVARTK